MFNIFKYKTHLIPTDLKKGLMSSTFCTIKLNEKLTIPENTVCLVCYKDKVYNELKSGTFTLSKELLLDIYEKQAKRNRKLKKLKLDLYFANTNTFEYKFNYVDKIPLNNKLTKLIFDISFSVKIENVKTFYKFVVSDWASADAFHTEESLFDYIEEYLRKLYLKQKLTSTHIENDKLENLKNKLTKHLEKIGLNLINFNLKLSPKTQIMVESHEKSNFFDPIEQETLKKSNEITENSIDQTENLVYTNNEINNTKQNQLENICPNCKSKIIVGSIYCHRCGHKFN